MTGDPIADGGDGDRPAQSRRFTYDLDADELPSHAVVRAVAAITNESPLDLEPLYDAVDPEHLDELFEGPGGGGGPDGRGDVKSGGNPDGGSGPAVDGPELSFTFAGFDVTVTEGTVSVRETDDD